MIDVTIFAEDFLTAENALHYQKPEGKEKMMSLKELDCDERSIERSRCALGESVDEKINENKSMRRHKKG